MKTSLALVIAAAAMVLGAGFANATVSGNVAALRTITGQSSAVQDVYWRRWHHHHRHCWWRHHHRWCRWW